jgi:nucleolar protein 58
VKEEKRRAKEERRAKRRAEKEKAAAAEAEGVVTADGPSDAMEVDAEEDVVEKKRKRRKSDVVSAVADGVVPIVRGVLL